MGVKDMIYEDMFFQACIQKLSTCVGDIARKRLSKRTQVENDKIVFMTYNDDFICNPRYIAEEIIRQELPYKLVWVVPKENPLIEQHFPPQIQLVKRGTYEASYAMASAKIWVDNALDFVWNKFPKKNNQYYIQTWHGSMGIKRIGENDIKNRRWVKAAKLCNRYTDYCISNSEFENNVYRETYWKDVPTKMYGHARNDMLFANETEAKHIKEKVLQYFGIEDENTKIFLYAPTFRDNGTLSNYRVNYEELLVSLQQRFDGNWIVLQRLHFHNRQTNTEIFTSKGVYDASHYPDIQELMVASDVGMTDYSSWAYDYILTKKPLFLYTLDRADYDNERGLYFTLESTPFSVAECNEELVRNILSFDAESYENEIDRFLKDKGCIEDGQASKRIVEMICQLMSE